MKVAAEADYYVKTYGAEPGLKHLKELGYDNLTYSITEHYDEPFALDWDEEKLKNRFTPVRDAIRANQQQIMFTLLTTRIYNDAAPETTAMRKKLCIQAIKATAYMGCGVMAVCPVSYHFSTDFVLSKKLTYEYFDMMKEEADKLGIRLAVVNNLNAYCYGSSVSELVELAEKYNAGIVIDPSHARYGGERMENLIHGSGNRLLGIMVTDTESRVLNPALPMMGDVSYAGVYHALHDASPDCAVITMFNPIYRRYHDFMISESFRRTLEVYYTKMTSVLAGADKEADIHD